VISHPNHLSKLATACFTNTMTAEIGQDEFWAEAAKGLVLLRLMAEAADADKESLHWVNRRVEQLEFVDERALRWRVSVDFDVPETAPITCVAGQDFRLVPLTSWEKDNLVAFDLRDEGGKAIWLPNSAETACLLSSALIYWAAGILNRAGKPEKVTPELEETLKAIVSDAPSPWQKEESREPRTNQGKDDPFTAVYDLKRELSEDVAKHYLDAAPPELKDHDQSFWSQVNELWRNFVIIAAVPDEPGTRRVFKMTFESKIDFRRPGNLFKRIRQSMGWDAWQLEMYIGGRGGSHHLEVAAPPGVDIIRMRARPRTQVEDRTRYVVSYGGSPHVHLRIPAQRLRYKATTRVRVSRPGWLTTCWLAGLAITGVLLAGALRLSVLFSNTTEAGTAATLLLALLAVVATMLVSPGTHPLASRLLWGARILILIDSGLVLLAAGSLLLNIYSSYPFPTKVGWWVLTVLSALCALGLTGSWLRPIGPQETLAKDKPLPQKTVAKDKPLPRETAAEDNKDTRKKKIELPSLTIPAADGYHYGDDLHTEWDENQQTALVRALKATQADLLSVLAHARGDYDEAARQHQRALDIFEQLNTLEEEREGSSPQPSPGT
jgi:hypothetical protein